MRRAGLLISILWSLAAPSLAAAQPGLPALPLQRPAPAGRIAVAPMTDVSFSALLGIPVESAYVRVSASPPDARGALVTQVASGQMAREPFSKRLSWKVPVISSLRTQPGTYWWQVVGLVRDQSGVLQEYFSQIQRVDMYFPRSWSKRGPIDRRYGHHGTAHFFLSTYGLPSGLDPARFRLLAAVSARRWGLHLDGWTSRSATASDGVNVVGFGPVPVAGALAVQRDRWRAHYHVFRHCVVHYRAGVEVGRDCGPVQQQYRGRYLADRDLIIDPTRPWTAGPARPDAGEFDLESVLIHELGHMAGNKKHAPRCSNSPMGPALGMGEWWRTPHDWYRRSCAPTHPRGLF